MFNIKTKKPIDSLVAEFEIEYDYVHQTYNYQDNSQKEKWHIRKYILLYKKLTDILFFQELKKILRNSELSCKNLKDFKKIYQPRKIQDFVYYSKQVDKENSDLLEILTSTWHGVLNPTYSEIEKFNNLRLIQFLVNNIQGLRENSEVLVSYDSFDKKQEKVVTKETLESIIEIGNLFIIYFVELLFLRKAFFDTFLNLNNETRFHFLLLDTFFLFDYLIYLNLDELVYYFSTITNYLLETNWLNSQESFLKQEGTKE